MNSKVKHSSLPFLQRNFILKCSRPVRDVRTIANVRGAINITYAGTNGCLYLGDAGYGLTNEKNDRHACKTQI